MEVKQRIRVELRALGDTGSFEATFATLGVIDKDGDVTVSGAFQDGQEVRISAWGHNWGALPVGKGTIHADDQRAWVDGQFFLDTSAGQETYKTVKLLGQLQEWSYGFDIKDQSFGEFEGRQVRFLRGLDVFEVSPVMIGAGVDTGTDLIKSVKEKAAIAPHGTATSDAAWDGPANQARLSNDAGGATYRRAAAWIDPEGDPDTKTAYRFWHHEVSADGAVGAANTRACSTGIGVLNGGRGGTTIPDADKAGVHRHLAKHLRDADMEPPPLKSDDQAEVKVGARNAAADLKRIQAAHDIFVELGAECTGEPKGHAQDPTNGKAEDPPAGKAEDRTDGKASNPSALALRIAAELLDYGPD